MDNITNTDKSESIKSIQSTIGKLENALSQMTQKGANTTLVKKRLKAIRVGLAALEKTWYQKEHHYNPEEMVEAHLILTGLFPSIKSSYEKAQTGSPQKTLLKRRLKALELAVQGIDDLSF